MLTGAGTPPGAGPPTPIPNTSGQVGQMTLRMNKVSKKTSLAGIGNNGSKEASQAGTGGKMKNGKMEGTKKENGAPGSNTNPKTRMAVKKK